MDKLLYKPIVDSNLLEVKAVQVSISQEHLIGSPEWCRLFDKACEDIKKLNHELPLKFFIFPLGSYLGDLKEVSHKILNVLRFHNFNPSFVKFEIAAMDNPQQMMEFMKNFRDALKNGIRLVVAKFPFKALGMARYFRNFISIIKLDLKTLKGISQNSLIQVAQKCGFEVTSSRLETEEELDLSRAAGADFMEGNYIAGYMHFDDLTHWMKMHRMHLI